MWNWLLVIAMRLPIHYTNRGFEKQRCAFHQPAKSFLKSWHSFVDWLQRSASGAVTQLGFSDLEIAFTYLPDAEASGGDWRHQQ
jgi:hypothetical protein